MNDFDSLLRQNLEIEGLLRLLRDRDNSEARQMLLEKTEAFIGALRSIAPTAESVRPAESRTETLTPQAEAPVLFDQEAAAEAKTTAHPEEETVPAPAPEHLERLDEEQAVGTEEPAEIDLAEAAVARGEKQHARTAPATHGNGSPKVLKAFTLNDRFRFTRELFGGNEADFTDTLRLLADMDTYAEAEDYLFNDMMWDAGAPGVSDFMAVLAANMNR